MPPLAEAVGPSEAGEEAAPSPTPGPVALVGAGPGDPELLTLRAARRLREAQVVLHDNLISEGVLALVPPEAELVNVGKRCGDPKDRGLQQREIHELLLRHSRGGRRVVRLKGGDPFVFGRGGEEVEFLAAHGVDAEVVPGVTSALGASAACCMPLTHRGFGVNQVRFLVGQTKSKELPELDWAQLARDVGKQSTVIYMGFKSAARISERLREEGAPGETPIAVVESATTPEQRVLSTTLSELPALVRKHAAEMHGPVLMLLGPTAAFPAHLEQVSGGRPWKRPCLGPRVER